MFLCLCKFLCPGLHFVHWYFVTEYTYDPLWIWYIPKCEWKDQRMKIIEDKNTKILKSFLSDHIDFFFISEVKFLFMFQLRAHGWSVTTARAGSTLCVSVSLRTTSMIETGSVLPATSSRLRLASKFYKGKEEEGGGESPSCFMTHEIAMVKARVFFV